MSLKDLIEHNDFAALAALKDLSAGQRKDIATELKTIEREQRAKDVGWESNQSALAVAGAAVLPNPSTLAPWLVRNEAAASWELVVDVLRGRDVPWLADLATRLAARIPNRARWNMRDDLFSLALALSGDTLPDSDGFLLHVIRNGPSRYPQGCDPLIPRMLEVVGVGGWVRHYDWPRFLLSRCDRGVLLDGCLARLQQGGTAGEMSGFLALHEAIGPRMAETEKHARDYVALLPDSRLPVATLAQDQLKWLDDGKKLDFGLLCDASRWVFGRTEKKLVRTQLSWLGKHAKDHPQEVVEVAGTLLSHESSDLRARATALIEKHGGEVVEQEPEPVAELAPFTPEDMPSPIATPHDLARELLTMFGRNGSIDAVKLERVLEAVVRFAWEDRAKLYSALEPLLTKYWWLRNESAGTQPVEQLYAVIRASVVQPQSTPVRRISEWLSRFTPPALSGMPEMLSGRFHEIAHGLAFSPRPALVSTPTKASGLLDPEVLAQRLSDAHAGKWQPWPDDLWQALRRLPRHVHPNITAQVPGKAGKLFREWIARGGQAEPEVMIAERERTPHHYNGWPGATEYRLFLTVSPGLLDPEQHWFGYSDWGPMTECWAAALPAHRDVVAAHLVPHLVAKHDYGPLLPILARADGPVGKGMRMALAYGLSGDRPVDRAHAVDALLVLAARHQLDGAALGEIAGLLLERGDLVLNRVVSALRDAARSGAAHQVWDLITVALPRIWSLNRVADVVELAVEIAQQIRPGGTIEGLTEAAARKGSSRVVTESKRLVAVLR